MTKVDFSSFIFMENTGLMVRVSSGVSSLADLNGKKVAVIIGTTNEAALVKEIQRRQFKTEVVRVRDRSDGIVALQSGAVDSFASDKLLLIGARNVDGSMYKMLPENLSSEPYALALPRGDWRLRVAVNKALSQLYSSPQILKFTANGSLPWENALICCARPFTSSEPFRIERRRQPPCSTCKDQRLETNENRQCRRDDSSGISTAFSPL